MQKFMKTLNNISRSQAIYRQSMLDNKELQSGHYAFVLAICREPGRSQEELARELCVNKSTVARHLNDLEEKGYIIRRPLPQDKRQFAVDPSEKMLALLPALRKASLDWMALLSEDISQTELDIFNAVLEKMQERAAKIIGLQEELV